MNNKTLLILIAGSLIACAALYYIWSRPPSLLANRAIPLSPIDNEELQRNADENKQNKNHSSAALANLPTLGATSQNLVVGSANPAAAKKEKEDQSLNALVRVLSYYALQTDQSADPKSLIRSLEKENLRPLLLSSTNPTTGKMVIVRTADALDGTRYFHAQYMTDEKNKSFLQHVSFEFRPANDAMAKAIASVQANFKGLGRPIESSADYVLWKGPGDYVVSITRLGSEDLKSMSDPFNAHSQADDGTLKIAMEKEIHPQDDPE